MHANCVDRRDGTPLQLTMIEEVRWCLPSTVFLQHCSGKLVQVSIKYQWLMSDSFVQTVRLLKSLSVKCLRQKYCNIETFCRQLFNCGGNFY